MSDTTSSSTRTTLRDAPEPDVRHPLDPLTAEEMSRAVSILRTASRLRDSARLSTVELHEPPKDEVLGWPDNGTVERQAFVIVMDRADGTVHEAVVSLDCGTVTGWRALDGVQPRIMSEEFVECEAMLKRHPDYLLALAKRGITDPDLLMVDPWSAGAADGASTRLARVLAWVRSAPGDNGYARPVEGLIALVDLAKMEVVRIEDHGVVALPPKPGNYTSGYLGKVREDLRPIEITQPQGPSFTVHGHEIRWQKWRVRIGFTARKGLVLHTVAYEDDGRLRPILYRASFSEMVVPYGEVEPTHRWKNAFDIGEYGIGAMANSLELGCDCLGEIRYFDAVLSDAVGQPVVLRNAICVHEEDASLLWKHTDWRTSETEVRRGRRLVISFVATVGNYEYGYYWYFQQDGAIECEVKLTASSPPAQSPPARPVRTRP